MTHTNRPLQQRATAPGGARRRNAPDFSDAVVTAYIHEISTRRRSARIRSRGHRGPGRPSQEARPVR